MRRNIAPGVVLALGLVAFVPNASADLALDLSTGGTALPCAACGANGTTFGWAFAVNSPITITGLGVWDAGSAGLGTATETGIFDSSGNTLTSVVISDSSTPVASASASGEWLFQGITPITLTPGTYSIGNVFYDTVPLAQVGASFTTIPQITLIEGVSGTDNGGFSADETPFTEPIFGATFEATVTPEPGLAGVLMLCLAGVLTLRLMRRRART